LDGIDELIDLEEADLLDTDFFDLEDEVDSEDLFAGEEELELDFESDFEYEAGDFETDLEDVYEAEIAYESEPEVIGPDTRKLIRDTTKIPFRFICHMSDGCTGTLVKPNKVLTVAHCIYNRNTMKQTWKGDWVTPGRNGKGSAKGNQPYGRATVARINFPDAYRTAKTYNDAWPHDYAVLTLDRSLPVPGGSWSRLRALPSKSLLKVKVNTAGYPGTAQRQYWTYNRIVSISGARMRHVLDTKPGQSGSPIWLKWRDTRSIVGLHKAGFTGSPQQNRGVVFTSANLANIKRWIAG
jgi:V8-like Glu-specific endopeptidase